MPGQIHRTTHASSKTHMMLGLVRVGSGIGVSDGCVGFGATGSGCTVCSVSATVVVAGSAWGVGSGLGSICTSSLSGIVLNRKRISTKRDKD